jgi:hypothetical protein
MAEISREKQDSPFGLAGLIKYNQERIIRNDEKR